MTQQKGCLKTEIHCDQMWEGGILLHLPRLSPGETIEIEMTVPDFGELAGEFYIESVDHKYTAKGTGYRQVLEISPNE